MGSYSKQSIWAMVGLTCLFAGIWTSDAAMIAMFDPPVGALTTRGVSLVMYLVVFLSILGITKAKTGAEPSAMAKAGADTARALDQRFVTIGVATCLALHALGFIVAAAAGAFGEGAVHGRVAFAAVVLLKCAGAPLSVALVWQCAQLPYRLIARTATAGILSAFLLKAILGAALSGVAAPQVAALAAGSILLFAAGANSLVALLRKRAWTQAPRGPVENSWTLAASTRQEGTRECARLKPLRALFNRHLAVGMVVASLMLGYLRAEFVVQDPFLQASVALVLVAVVLLACLTPFVGMSGLFRGALVCTGASLLLAPLLAPVMPQADIMLGAVGAALFEAVVLIVSIALTQVCTSPLRAAAAARLIVVIGHLAGAALADGAAVWSATHTDAADAVRLTVAFCYLVMLLYLLSGPPANLQFVVGPSAAASQPPAPLPQVEAIQRTSLPPSPITHERTHPSPASSSPSSDTLWKAPCKAIAARYGLTPRETDVLEQLAQGRDLAYIEERFVLSRNTVKMHIKHVYAKLGVHSKREVIDLVHTAR